MSDKTITPEELKKVSGPTELEVEQKVTELTERLKCKVHPFVFLFNNRTERVVGYVREPHRMEKIQYMDRLMTAPASAAMNILEACLIREESDSRITTESPEYDNLYTGAVSFIQSLMTMSYDVHKKK